MAEKVILKNGIVCTMKKVRRSRHIRIVIHQDGNVVLTLPFFVSYAKGREFLESKAAWISEKVTTFLAQPKNILHQGGDKEYQESRVAAQKHIEKRLAHFQNIYGVSWKRVSIRNQKTRWGSCSRTGNLSFNYRLLLLPPHLCDYVVVHELCHLLEMNHSNRFWALMAKTFPDYRELRRELRLL